MSRPAPSGQLAAANLYAADDMARLRAVAFSQARRHSRRVYFLRYALPIAVIGGLVLIVLGSWLDPLRFYRGLPIEFGKLSISGNKLTMEAPKLSGFTRDQRPYSVTAHSAAQDLTKPNVVELSDIQGRVERDDRTMTELRARSGLYDTKAEFIHLFGGIMIQSGGGYQMWLSEADIEVRKGHVISNHPVNAVFPDGNLQANRLEVFDHGALAVFDGGVTMTVMMPPPADSEIRKEKK